MVNWGAELALRAASRASDRCTSSIHNSELLLPGFFQLIRRGGFTDHSQLTRRGGTTDD